MEERRHAVRVRVLRNAKLIVGADVPLVRCTLHDLTPSGARLSLAGTASLPDLFELTLDHGRSRRPCRVVWRSANDVGVVFEKSTG